MTYRTKYNQNKRLLKGYVDFLPECTTYEDRLKLSTEIGRLNAQNKLIEKMGFQETEREINDYNLKLNAVL